MSGIVVCSVMILISVQRVQEKESKKIKKEKKKKKKKKSFGTYFVCVFFSKGCKITDIRLQLFLQRKIDRTRFL